MVLATIFFALQIFVGGGMNYGLYAVVFAVPATGYITKVVCLKRKNDTILAAVYTGVVLFFTIVHIRSLISSSTIL